MPTLSPTQRKAYNAFSDLWKHRGISPSRAHAILQEVCGYTTTPYFMELDVDEAERIAHKLRPDNLLPLLEAAGRRTGICIACGRELTDPKSIARGIGPVCGGKISRKIIHDLEDLLS